MHLRVSNRSMELLASLLAEKYTDDGLLTLGAEIGVDPGEIKGIGSLEKARFLVHLAAEDEEVFEKLLYEHMSNIESNANLIKALRDDGIRILLPPRPEFLRYQDNLIAEARLKLPATELSSLIEKLKDCPKDYELVDAVKNFFFLLGFEVIDVAREDVKGKTLIQGVKKPDYFKPDLICIGFFLPSPQVIFVECTGAAKAWDALKMGNLDPYWGRYLPFLPREMFVDRTCIVASHFPSGIETFAKKHPNLFLLHPKKVAKLLEQHIRNPLSLKQVLELLSSF